MLVLDVVAHTCNTNTPETFSSRAFNFSILEFECSEMIYSLVTALESQRAVAVGAGGTEETLPNCHCFPYWRWDMTHIYSQLAERVPSSGSVSTTGTSFETSSLTKSVILVLA